MGRSEKQIKQLFSRYKSKNSKNDPDNLHEKFKDYVEFEDWYNLQEKECYYCGLEEENQFKIIDKKLTSKRFFSYEKDNYRGTRGKFLEIDKKNPELNYSKGNCVLCCYFCNNDKSDVFDESQYKEFTNHGKERVKYLRSLLVKNIISLLYSGLSPKDF